MSAVCLRYRSEELNREQERKLHHSVASRIERSGDFWFATTEMKGKTWFRINPVNIHTTEKHIRDLYAILTATCRETERLMKSKKAEA